MITSNLVRQYLIEQQGFDPHNSESAMKIHDCTWSMFRRTVVETKKRV